MWNIVQTIQEKKRKTSNSRDATVVEENSDNAYVLSATVNNSGDEWILDSGCSY